jgi:hypothetical protein
VVLAVSVPEVPVIVIVEVPSVDVQLDVSVSTLLPVVGLVLNAAVTPLGNPDTASATLPVNPPTSVTVIVSVALLPGVTDRVDAEGLSVKLPIPTVLTVSATVVDEVSEPEVPVMATVDVPAFAVLLAVSVSTPVPVVGLVPNAAVTPVGNPDAARVTLPAKGLTSVTVMVSVALPPWVTAKVAAEGLSEKLPVPVPPQVTPLSANDVGTELVVPFQDPLNPMPARLPTAGILPL